MDRFETAGVRERVLAGWAASAARFREDANAEEDFALGGYRDRLVVELAQNAADAAVRAGTPGRVRFTLYDEAGRPVLAVANTGEPLTPAGVESLATLRASAKRDPDQDSGGTVGRFGVGFAAVLAVTDEPVVLSRTGGVRFSRQDTAAEVARVPGLAEEVRRRDGHVPVLRLPFAADGVPPDGFDTTVLLPLHDEAAADLVRRQLADTGDALLLALPALDRLEIDADGNERVLTAAADRWYVHRATGPIEPKLFDDRPTEERRRPFWSVLWALPKQGAPPATVHAPTPTDEPLTLPALLLASFPLDPSRRHVAPGPLTDLVVDEAASAYAELVRQRAEAGGDILGLVPTGLAGGALDARLREAIIEKLPSAPILARAEDGALIRPRDAVVVDRADDAFVDTLAPIVSGLVRGADRSALAALDVRKLDLADLVDQLHRLDREPAWWRTLYAALAAMVADPLTRDALGALPVPLADGRLVRGARGAVLGENLAGLAGLAPYGLRVVHHEAAHPVLERLGAIEAAPRALLDDGAVRAAVENSLDADDPDALAEAVLAIAGAAETGHDDWLAELALRDADGELVPAGSLVFPGSEAEAILDADEFAPVAAELAERHHDALRAVGVLDTLGISRITDVALDLLPDVVAELDGAERWARETARHGSTLAELSVVRDLDYVTDWPRALGLFGSDRALRDALVRPVRVAGPGTGSATVPAYTAWWIRANVGLAGLADPDADAVLADLLEPPPDWAAALDPEVRRAAGLVRRAEDLDAAGVAVVLQRLAEPRDVPAEAMLRLWPALAAAYPGEPPAWVRVLDGERTRVVDAEQALVADAPMWLQRTDLGGYVLAPGPAADGLAELLDVPLAGDVAAGAIGTEGTPAPVPELVRRLVPETPGTWWEHEELLVDGQQVSWWVDDDGRPHAATGDGLAKALAWAAGRWDRRHLIETALSDPGRAAELVTDAAFDPIFDPVVDRVR